MFYPPHPGEVLRELLPQEMTIEEAAGLVTHTTRESWLTAQAEWDLWQASRKAPPRVTPFRKAA